MGIQIRGELPHRKHLRLGAKENVRGRDMRKPEEGNADKIDKKRDPKVRANHSRKNQGEEMGKSKDKLISQNMRTGRLRA